ncbi:MAG TPA: nitronate monooxygenase [Candidatus Heimdallarchaeota archaeon]|nr:nitronate monooxygenase [Candidatus Heimdallarchaeota archaeon]
MSAHRSESKANRICRLLDIRYPIFLGGMAHVSRAPLVAAVSDAGGLGIVGSGGMSAEILAEQIALVREKTNQPFGVNLMLMDPNIDEQVAVVVRERVPVVTTGAGNPAKYLDQLRSADIKVFPVVPVTALARRMERAGVDGIIAEGTESGGHVGEVTTMVLVPQVVDAVSVPVVAAGGIADGRGLAAALALGAEGVQSGTVFLASAEAPVHDNYKQAILNANDRSTLVTGRDIGAPVRAIANKMTKEFARYEKEGRPLEEFEHLAVGGLCRAVYEGDVDTGSLMAGQISGLIREIKPVQTIIQDMVRTAAGLLQEGALDLDDGRQ